MLHRSSPVGRASARSCAGRAAAAVQHDHVVTICESVKRGNAVSGGNCSRRSARRPAESVAAAGTVGRRADRTRDRRRIGCGPCSGLLHQDIKPSNIWLATPAARQILDFGGGAGSRRRADSEVPSSARRHICRRNNPRPAGWTRSDLFSLGCVLYGMIAGLPFQEPI